MAEREPDDPTPGVRPGPVGAWLAEHLPGLTPPLRFTRLAGGRSNLTHRVSDAAGRRVVLRRPPLGDVPATAHDVLREGRLLAALAGSAPVPRVLAQCADPEVTGAPFVVMEHLDGLVVRDPATAAALPPAVRRRAGPALVDALLALHAVDPAALGRSAGRRDYAARQLRRWDANLRRVRTRELPDLERAGRLLAERIPAQRRTAVVHGDFRLDNCVLDASGAVTGILDWELATAGDPLADLGQLLVYWAEPDDDATALHAPPTRTPGFATRAELRERYLAATGADPQAVAYYTAFNWWKTACIVEGVHARTLRGEMGRSDRSAASFGEQARALAARAVREAAAAHRDVSTNPS